jgi:hypothetical protein
MRDLFDQITQDGEPAIDQFVAVRFQENVELEFKSKQHPNNGDLTKDDRKNLGIALSALSNSMGGLLIWGVEAGKNADGVDCATAVKPISQIEKFRTEVERAISQAIMPRHEGIRISIIRRSAEPNSGYLAVHVERSERRPHRCEFGEKQYFKRVGDSSIAMEHYDIEDSFKRFTAPRLEAEYRLSNAGRRSGPNGSFATVRVIISLRNTSNMSAQYPYLKLEETQGIRPGAWYAGPDGGWLPLPFQGGADVVIHPDLVLQAMELDREFPIVHPTYLPRGTLEPPMLIRYRCGCLHSRPTFGTFSITEQQIATALELDIA